MNLFIKPASNLTQSTDFSGTQHECNANEMVLKSLSVTPHDDSANISDEKQPSAIEARSWPVFVKMCISMCTYVCNVRV